MLDPEVREVVELATQNEARSNAIGKQIAIKQGRIKSLEKEAGDNDTLVAALHYEVELLQGSLK
ncbi:MAG: hypothetical protein JZU63_05310, partial [Rhodoferax sp.]|nr:hypothetical protein [Rhodoferax sp.]